MSNPDDKPNFRRRSPVAIDDCSMAMTIDLIGDRWSLLILREALYGVAKFEDIRTDIGIPKSILSSRLSRLVENGILQKVKYQEPGTRGRHAYVPSDKGRELGLALLTFMQWGDRHMREGHKPLAMQDRGSRQNVRPSLVNEHGIEVSMNNLRLVVRKP